MWRRHPGQATQPLRGLRRLRHLITWHEEFLKFVRLNQGELADIWADLPSWKRDLERFHLERICEHGYLHRCARPYSLRGLLLNLRHAFLHNRPFLFSQIMSLFRFPDWLGATASDDECRRLADLVGQQRP